MGVMATLKVPDKVGDLGGYLKEQRENARLSLRQLASVAGVSNPYLSQIERGLRKPSAEVLQQIAKGLQISAEALFLRAGLLEESVGVVVEVAIQSDVHLTARQKRVLLDIYATFRGENARAVAESNGESARPDGEHPESEASEIVADAKVVPLIAAESLKSGSSDADAAGDEGSKVTPKRSASKRTTAKTARAVRSAKTGRAASS
jgi:transcriptional regulator with XRE-family HTH domain